MEFYRQIIPGFYTNDIYASTQSDSTWFLDAASQKLLLQYGHTTKIFSLPSNPPTPPYRHFAMEGNKYFLSDLFNIYRCDFSADKNVRLSILDADTNRNANIAFSCLVPDGYGNLIATSENITVLLSNNKIISYPLGYLADGLVLTPEKYLWVITRSSYLFVFRIHPETPDHYLEWLKTYHDELPSITPRSIAIDRQGNIWIGTRDSGLYCLYFKGGVLQYWKHFTVQDGLSQNFISYLHIDPDNTVWACSPAGLDRVSSRNGKFTIENITLSSNIYQHVVKIQTTKSGVHWAVTESSLVKISPGKSPPITFQPKIIFREIYEGKNRLDLRCGSAIFFSLPGKQLIFFSFATQFY